MMSRRHEFRGQFGINETPLTLAIGSGKFELAEEIVKANTDVAYLNDGPYQNVPLHMVLTNDYTSCWVRNLKLARLLITSGANPNLRIPFMDFDRTFHPSPFEELVVSYEALRYFACGRYEEISRELDLFVKEDEILDVIVRDTIDVDGNECEASMSDCERLIKQLSDLIDIFLENGSDPNVITTFHRKTLFHWCVEFDMDLAEQLLKTCRVNINLSDAHGNSPLMDTILSNNIKLSLDLYAKMRETGDSVDINNHNCTGETALFRACFVGAVELATKLLEDGAKVCSKVCITRFPFKYPNECEHCAALILYLVYDLPSPLLAPLLSDATARLRYDHVISGQEMPYSEKLQHKHLTDKIVKSSISPLVDFLILKFQGGSSSNLCVTSLLDQFLLLLEHTTFDHLRDGRVSTTDLVSLMFGQLSSGLRQLAVRAIFDHVLMVSGIPERWPSLVPQSFCMKACEGALKEEHTMELIELLKLPVSFRIFFDIEVAKYQLCRMIVSCQTLECQQACSESEFSVLGSTDTSESDMSSDHGASIILFSSDALSEESSEEVDDLSDEDFSDDDDEEVASESMRHAEGEAPPVRRKVKCNYESLSSSSDDIRVVVETLCEDVAESMAHQQHDSKCPDKYQKLSRESTTSSPTFSNCTSPSSSSEPAAKILRGSPSSDLP